MPDGVQRTDVVLDGGISQPVLSIIGNGAGYFSFRDRGITRRRAGAAIRTAGRLGSWRSNIGRARPGGIHQFSGPRDV